MSSPLTAEQLYFRLNCILGRANKKLGWNEMWPDLFQSFFQPLLYADFQFPSCITLLNRLPSTQRPFSRAKSSMTENLATMGQSCFKSEIDTEQKQKGKKKEEEIQKTVSHS